MNREPTHHPSAPDGQQLVLEGAALEAEALRLDSLRCEALLKGDAALLGTLVSPALRYRHSTGRLDSRDSYLAGVASGTTRYLKIDREEIGARAVGTAVIVEGRVRLEVELEGERRTMSNFWLSVWAMEGGSLVMTAWASTRAA